MHAQISQKAISKILLLFSITLLVWVFSGQPASAQVSKVYVQLTGTYNTFVNTSEFEIDKHKFLPGIHTGIGFYLGEAQIWKLNWETGFEVRGFIKEYPFVKSNYTFISFTNKILLEFPITPRLNAEGGLGLDFYQSFFKENEVYRDIGEGVRAIDLLIVGGMNYELLNWLNLGVRIKYGFVPMFYGRKVLDYGGLSEKKNHVNICAGEVLLRFVIFRNKK